MSSTLTVTSPTDRQIDWTRDFRAPRELVFDAMTQPEHVRRWWGQKGSTLAVCEIDLRVGGGYRYVERAADGNEYQFRGAYREIERPVRLVFTQIFDMEPHNGSESVASVKLTEQDGVTTLAGSIVFPSVEDRDAAVSAGMERGMGETYDRLEELLAEVQG